MQLHREIKIEEKMKNHKKKKNHKKRGKNPIQLVSLMCLVF
jgi:hypothetical protein